MPGQLKERQNAINFCNWGVAYTDKGLVIATGLTTMLLDEATGEWVDITTSSARSPSPVDLIPVGGQAVLLPTAGIPTGQRIFRSVFCDAGLDEAEDEDGDPVFPVGRNVVSILEEVDRTYLLMQSVSDPEVYDVVELREPSEPADLDYRRCWDTPLVEPLPTDGP